MIGVAVKESDARAAGEFFELFKTGWESAVPGRKYSVVLADGVSIEGLQADAFVVYGATSQPCDIAVGAKPEFRQGPIAVEYTLTDLPIYGHLALFGTGGAGSLLTVDRQCADYRSEQGGGPLHRIGYDLFTEVRRLLTDGQPAAKAAVPTLDRHIDLLRRLLMDFGTPFVELLPKPGAHDFICCLTHDLDFFGIRRHGFDRTLLGFAVRASIGTLVDLFRRRRTMAEAMRNWVAVLSLPLVMFGLRRDLWNPFDDYAVGDRGHPATYFLIPFRQTQGAPGPGEQSSTGRSVAYQASDVRDEARSAAVRGGELAVHGIDAWRDAAVAQMERAELVAITGGSVPGVRMHWLYFDSESPARLEDAGFEYDSTYGFNDAIGFRAGTSQAFRPLTSRQLLELPLSIMDSAMFFPGRMGLTRTKAMTLCRAIVAHARHAGGTVVVNWHDRSLAPERLWGGSYEDLLNEVGKDGRAWFATAGQAVGWYRWRRSVRLVETSQRVVSVTASPLPEGLPPVRVAAHGRLTTEVLFDGRAPLEVHL